MESKLDDGFEQLSPGSLSKGRWYLFFEAFDDGAIEHRRYGLGEVDLLLCCWTAKSEKSIIARMASIVCGIAVSVVTLVLQGAQTHPSGQLSARLAA